MSKGKIIASLDVGSHKIRTVIGTVDEQTNQIQVIAMGFAPRLYKSLSSNIALRPFLSVL